MIVGRTFKVAGLVAVPFAFVAVTDPVSPLSGTVNWKLVADTGPGVTEIAPSLAVGSAPVARKFEPFTVTFSQAEYVTAPNKVILGHGWNLPILVASPLTVETVIAP